MPRLLFLLLLLLLVLWSPHALEAPEHSGVLLLSHSSFAAAARAFQPLFVLVDAPARKGSLELFRAFADAAVTLRASQRETAPRMRFAFLDVLAASDVPDRLGVVGLPGLVRLRCSPKVGNLVPAGTNATTTTSSAGCSLDDAEVESYAGGRTSAEFQRFMLDQPQREVVVLYDQPALSALVAANPFVVLVVVDGRDTQPYFDAISLAQTDAGASVFAVSANRALLASEDEQRQIPSLVVFRDFGATRLVYSGLWRKSAILSFLAATKYSAVSTYSARFPSFLYDSAAAAHVLLFSNDTLAQHEELLAQLHLLALPYASPLLTNVVRFVYVPANESALRSSLFVRDRHVPALLIVRDVGAPATRFPIFGRDLLAAVETTRFTDALGALLDDAFPLVFRTAVLDEGEEDDDGAFENVLAEVAVPDPLPGGQRELRSADVESGSSALSPWELHRQQRALVYSVRSARWVLEQQEVRDVVVSFWSPRCFGCRAFASVYEQAARVALDGGAAVVFASVNVDEVVTSPLGVDVARLPSVFAFPRGASAAPVAFESRSFTLANVLAFVALSCPSVASSSSSSSSTSG